MWACRHTLDGSVGGRLHDTTGVLAESGSEKQGRKDMSKANKGAWQNSATGIASHRIASHRIALHCSPEGFCVWSLCFGFFLLWYRDNARKSTQKHKALFSRVHREKRRTFHRIACVHAKYPDVCERKTGIGVVHRLVVIASYVLHRSLRIL